MLAEDLGKFLKTVSDNIYGKGASPNSIFDGSNVGLAMLGQGLKDGMTEIASAMHCENLINERIRQLIKKLDGALNEVDSDRNKTRPKQQVKEKNCFCRSEK